MAQKTANHSGAEPAPNARQARPVLASPNDSKSLGDIVDPRKPLMPFEKAYAIGSRLVIPPIRVKFNPKVGSFNMTGFTKFRQFLVT